MALTGIGAFGFRAKDRDALAAWYAEQLGVGEGNQIELWEPA